jgi:two-component system sensor histidine kinase PilS (NtrC family)
MEQYGPPAPALTPTRAQSRRLAVASLRPLSFTADQALRAMLDPRRMVRWLYIGRLVFAAVMLVAALFMWRSVTDSVKFLSALAFAAATFYTVASAAWTELAKRSPGRTFLYLQSIFDLMLVTTIVHVTGGSGSQFAALYILVIATASLLLPSGGGLLVAALGNVLYFADAIWGHGTTLSVTVWLQLGVFAVVALGSGFVSARLHAAGAGKDVLAAELVKVRLEAADILRNIRSGVLTIADDGRLLFANPAASTLLGFDLREHVGAPFLDLLTERAPALARALASSARDGTRTNRGEGMIRAGSREFEIGVTTTYADAAVDEGSPAAASSRTATAIFQDISDQKRLEALHLRAERLEAVAELSASLAHEIKNPLASIRSAVEQLARRPRANDDERTLGSLIVRESDRLSRLLSEFLDFARVRVTKIERVDLAAVVSGVAGLVGRHPDRAADVTLECLVPDEPLLIDGDEDLLHRAVFNLALNAVQATPAGGRVSVEVAPALAEQLPGGVTFEQGAVVLRVTDTGPGIPREIRDRLFDPFFTTKPGGSGLGLPVVHRAIEAHRGLVFVDGNGNGNGAGAGTRFTVLLPRAQFEPGGVS